MRVKEDDEEGMRKLFETLPEGWVAGPTHCPIGLDSNPMICSAGYCIGCLWLRAHWDNNPKIKLTRR